MSAVASGYNVVLKELDLALRERNEALQHTPTEPDNVPSIKTTAESSAEHLKLPDASPTILGGKTEVSNTIVCREWQTECAAVPHGSAVFSCIPEKDAVLWQIKDLTAFRAAARDSQIPPLVSPEFGGGCLIKLQLYDKKGHISGHVELPLLKATRDGVAHFKISVVRPDLKAIITRKVEMKVNVSSCAKRSIDRSSAVFKLTKCRTFKKPRLDHLVHEDSIRIRIEFQYYPFDAAIFRGSPGSFFKGGNNSMFVRSRDGTISIKSNATDEELHAELLRDIQDYCKEDTSQYVEIKKDDMTFKSCRFLLCARSKKFREIFGSTNMLPGNISHRGSPARIFSRGPSMNISLSSITIQDISNECLDQLLSFIHTNTCQWCDDYSADVFKTLELFEAADTYGVESLTRRLLRHLEQRLNTENFVFMFEVSERCGNAEFKEICTKFMDTIPGSQIATLMRVSSTPENQQAN